jgi:hypothetical protein
MLELEQPKTTIIPLSILLSKAQAPMREILHPVSECLRELHPPIRHEERASRLQQVRVSCFQYNRARNEKRMNVLCQRAGGGLGRR